MGRQSSSHLSLPASDAGRSAKTIKRREFMIWTIKIECDFGRFLVDECVRVIEIKSNASLFDLHDAIQDAVGFDRDHLFEFFAGRHRRNREIVYADTFDAEEDFDAYADISIEQVFPLPDKLKLFYHFDFGDDWYFKIIKSRKKPFKPSRGVKYPRVTQRVGSNPEQYPNWE